LRGGTNRYPVVEKSIVPEGIEAENVDATRLSSDLAASHALDHALHDPEGQKAAAAFLSTHKRFIDLQIDHFHEERASRLRSEGLKRASDVLRLIAQVAFLAVGLAFASGVGAMWWDALSSRSVIVSSFDAPQSMAASGLTGRVISGKLLDVLLQMQSATRLAAAHRQIKDAWSDSVEVELPETGVSLGQVSNVLHRMFGHDTHIDGALVDLPNGGLSLSIRGDDIPPASFVSAHGDVDDLTRQAAEYVFGRAEPDLFARYLIDTNRLAQAILFIHVAFATASDEDRPALANLWGEALLNQNKLAEAADRFRLAIQIDPFYWRAQNNLVGILPAVTGEEAAYREGIAMRRLAQGLIFRPGPSLYDQTNFAQLTLDPAKVIAGLLYDRALAQAEGAEYDSNSWIAEQQAVLHNWGAVSEFLAESPSDDVTTAFDVQAMAGLRAMEQGDYAGAVRHFEVADSLWRATATLQAYFPDFQCNLGLAYAHQGQMARAWPLFAAQRYVRCRAFHADVLDLAGRWPEAQHAYRLAEAVAPSLAFAYEREGAALLRHGDPKGAIYRLRIAHLLSPRWADPLKVWGDALVAEQRISAALFRYRQALRRAPQWDAVSRDLSLSRQKALTRSK
jgi:tetratricopeptide (TPR) repeat protein